MIRAMFPVAPLPSWNDLAAALLASEPDGDTLAAPWRHGDERAFWFSRGAWAMAALAHAVQENNGSARVWLPGHFCNQSTEPLRATGARLHFYPIDPATRAPDWTACRAKAAADGPPDLFFLVHTFGRANDSDGARAFCSETGARLIEDAAHALGPAPGIGEAGDAVFYSPAKLLAIPAGGLLLLRNIALAERIEARGPAAPSGKWTVKRAIQKLMPAELLAARVRRSWPAFDADPAWTELPRTPGLNGAARRMIARAATRLAETAERRRTNALVLTEALDGLAGCAPLFTGDEAAAPYRFVLRSTRAAELFDGWRSAGLPVETWPDLPPEVTAAPEAHAGALELRRTLLLLPVHQGLRADALGIYRKFALEK